MTPILMPQIGQDITRGMIVRWHKRENDPVRRGELVLTVESEKASFDVEADADGVLLRVLFKEGEEAEVLTPVGYIGAPGEKATPEAPVGEASGPRPTSKAPAPQAAPVGTAPRRVFASPSARRVAGGLGINLNGITGTGPGGRIMRRDVDAAARRAPSS